MTKKKKINGTEIINHKKVERQTQTKNNLIFEKVHNQT